MTLKNILSRILFYDLLSFLKDSIIVAVHCLNDNIELNLVQDRNQPGQFYCSDVPTQNKHCIFRSSAASNVNYLSFKRDPDPHVLFNINYLHFSKHVVNICLTSLTRAKPKEKMEFPA